MHLRSWFEGVIANQYPEGLRKPPVAEWSLEECRTFLGHQTIWHRFLVGCDMAWSQLGGGDTANQCATVSTRCAKRCSRPFPPNPTLVFSVFLELVDPGHLQDAWAADLCRARLVLSL